MQLPSAVAWSVLLAGANAELRVFQRPRGVCSMEIVATVTRTYTITTSDEVVLCNTAPGGSGTIPSLGGPASSSATISSISSESPVAPPSNGKEKIDSNLPFDSLIPSDYFPDFTVSETSAVVTTSASASTSPSVPSSFEQIYSSPTTISTSIVPVVTPSAKKDTSTSSSPAKTATTEGAVTQESPTSEGYQPTPTPSKATESEPVASVTSPGPKESEGCSTSTSAEAATTSTPEAKGETSTTTCEDEISTTHSEATTSTTVDAKVESSTTTCEDELSTTRSEATTSTTVEAKGETTTTTCEDEVSTTHSEATTTSTPGAKVETSTTTCEDEVSITHSVATTSTTVEAKVETTTTTCEDEASTSTKVSTTSTVEAKVESSTTTCEDEVSTTHTKATSTCTDELSTSAKETSTTCTDEDKFKPVTATTTKAAATTEAVEAKTTTTSTTSAESSTAAQPKPSVTRNYPADIVDKLQDASMDKLKSWLKRNGTPGCTLENAAVRREWGDLSVAERKEYTKAVQCLMKLPSKTPSNIAAGAKSRYDDFIVTHIQQTNKIHNTASFLAWHRHFTRAHEKALRDECGYTGYQPYWNWDRYANDPINSPIFNGGEGSLGGNSKNGGCAATGPFEKLQINLGPGYQLGYNPRCIKRDVSRYFAQQCTADKTMAVLNEQEIGRFQDHMQYSNGIHAGGHFTIGGDPGGDVYASPGDPAFFIHHAMIDRVWWIWLLQDLDTRLKAIAGRVGGGNNNMGTLQDTISLGYAGEDAILGDLMNTMGGNGGDYCYIYV